MQNVNALLVGAAAATLVVVALLGTSADGRQSLYTAPATAVRTTSAPASAVHSFTRPAQHSRHFSGAVQHSGEVGDVPVAQSSLTTVPVVARAQESVGSFAAAAALLAASLFAGLGFFKWAQSKSSSPLAPLSMQEVVSNQPEWSMAMSCGAHSLEGRVAVVTGATRGIGAAIAKKLGEAGATVIGTATSEGGASAISEALAAAGVTGEGMQLDVCDKDALKAAVKDITAKYGAPTIVVNNAGITRDKLMMQMKNDDWDSVIDTNLSAVFRVSQAFQRGMQKQKWGRIVNISSVVGSMGNMGQTNYAAAKAGLGGFTRSLAREMASRGVTVNCVAPGFIETDMTKDLPEEWADKLKSNIPAGRMGSVDEVASAVMFLASPDASYITGETIHVNGGMFMH